MDDRRTVRWRIGAAALCAGVFVLLQPALETLARERPGIFPFALCALVCGLFSPRLRQPIIVTLCFAIGVTAAHSTFGYVTGSNWRAEPFLAVLGTMAWAAIALLTLVAGTIEAARPGSVTAARCYFAAVAVYMGGCGFQMWITEPGTVAVVVAAIGALAAMAAFYAERLVPSAGAADSPQDPDIQDLTRRAAERAATLALREWKDTP